MPNFYWKGMDALGSTLSGCSLASSVDELRNHLLAENIALLSVKPQSNYGSYVSRIFSIQRLSAYEFVNFFEQLSILISGGVELLNALQTISSQSRNHKIKNVIESIKSEVEHGNHLSVALGKSPEIFDEFVIQMIGVGEDSGKLDLVLTELAEYLKKNYQLRRDLQGSAAVPLFTLLFAFAIIIVIFVGVVPQFQTFFTSLGKNIPKSTQKLMAISDFLRSRNLIFAALGLVLAGSIGFLIFGKLKMKRFKDFILLRLPFFSQLMIVSNLTNFLHSLNLLLKSGIPIKDAVLTASTAVRNVYLKEKLLLVVDQLIVGKSFADSLVCLQDLYKYDMLVSLIRVGEEAGNLNLVLDKACLFFGDEIKRMTVLMTSLFQPLLLVVIGFIVGILVWIIYLPIINLAYSLN